MTAVSLGYGFFITEPNAHKLLKCNICGAKCRVKRNLPAKSGWIATMGGAGKPHDVFHCPKLKKKWHDKAIDLVMEIEETPSKRLAKLMKKDLKDLLREHNIN
jgi:hypothetical protein